MEKITAAALIVKYKEGTCNAEELALLESWYLEKDTHEIDLSLAEINLAKSKVWAALPVHEQERPSKKLWFNYYNVAAAAVVLICTSFALYFYLGKSNAVVKPQETIAQILPGGKKAILKLADGTAIALNDAGNGKLTDQAGVSVFKTANGELAYNANTSESNEVQMNTLIIPNGGYYTLTLADGTKVWLNSASSLKYPTTFNGPERVVELTGEGYFEVAHNASQPFKVVTNRQTVQVLGTHFNINAYDDEPSVATTLLEGSVRVTPLSSRAKAKDLKPGQQANLDPRSFTVREVKTENTIAWTTNSFIFEEEELGSILRKISRWYDVEVVCPDRLSSMVFNGSISRSKSIKQVLRIMQLTESIHFKFEGRRITVMP